MTSEIPSIKIGNEHDLAVDVFPQTFFLGRCSCSPHKNVYKLFNKGLYVIDSLYAVITPH